MEEFFMYVDESGDPGDYRLPNGLVNAGSSRYFTLAGIIVGNPESKRLGRAINSLIKRHFAGMPLPGNFKLHYHQLIHNRPPYDRLPESRRRRLEEEVFGLIKESSLRLLSVTVDLEKYRKKDKAMANPDSYAFLHLWERFQGFLGGERTGRVIYERLGKNHKVKIKRDVRKLARAGLGAGTTFQRIRQEIEGGDPVRHPVLQLADFFACVGWRRSTSSRGGRWWESIKSRYCKMDESDGTGWDMEV